MTPTPASPALTEADQALREEPPLHSFCINPVGGSNIRAEGTDRFATEAEAFAYADWARTTIATLRSDLAAALIQISELAQAKGEAEGRLRASEMAGVVEGWRERALKAEAEKDRLAADLRKAREERDAHFMSLAAATCELMRGAHSGGAEIQALRKVCLLQARELKRLDPDGDTPVDLNAAMEKLRAALTPDPKDAGGTAKGDDHAA